MSVQKHDWMDEDDSTATDKIQSLIDPENENFENGSTIKDDFESSGDNSNIDSDEYITYQKSNIIDYIVKQNEFINLSYYNIDNLKSLNGDAGVKEEANEENHDSNQVFDENISKYHCKKCNKSFDVFKLFEKHIFYRHTGIKRHQCKECDYATNNLSHLKRHIKTHADQHIIHKCSHCNFTCDSSRSLKRHAYTHENIRPYKCPFCPYASVTLNHLTRHKLIHC